MASSQRKLTVCFTILTIYELAATHCGQDCYLARLWQWRFKQLFVSDIFIVKENVDVRSELTSLVYHPVTQSNMLLP